MVITQNRTGKIIPIAGGKGGVGKTEVCANLGVRLGQLGYNTVVMDLDLGGSNLHSTLGLKNKNPGVGNFLSDRGLSFQEIISSTPYPNLRFIPGDVLVANTPNISFTQKRSLIRHIEEMEADYILIDLGSGASNNVVDFFLASNSGIIVTSPHVGAILNAYSFLKNTTVRFLMRAFSAEKKAEKFLRQTVKERRPGSPVSVSALINGLGDIDPAFAARAERILGLLKPQVVLNMVRSMDDLNISSSLRELVSKNLNYQLGALGMIFSDEVLAKSHRAHNPQILEEPQGLMALQVDRIAQKIVQSPDFPTLALDTNMYADSYELMRIEAEHDFSSIPQAPDPATEQEANTREFIEILSAQKQRIQELQNTVRVLTMRNP